MMPIKLPESEVAASASVLLGVEHRGAFRSLWGNAHLLPLSLMFCVS